MPLWRTAIATNIRGNAITSPTSRARGRGPASSIALVAASSVACINVSFQIVPSNMNTAG